MLRVGSKLYVGGDFTNAMKAAKEFGITKTMKLAGLLIFINDIHTLGLKEVAANPSILRAVSPTYAAQFVADDPKMGFFALGSVFLAVTGAEAIYADMGHFGRKAITRAWLVAPAITLEGHLIALAFFVGAGVTVSLLVAARDRARASRRRGSRSQRPATSPRVCAIAILLLTIYRRLRLLLLIVNRSLPG